MKRTPEFYPNLGDKLYLSQQTGDYWVDMVKMPYLVIAVDSDKVTIQECRLVFNGPVYYDTVADDIVDDPYGRVKYLTWASNKKYHGWVLKDDPHDPYPYVAHFGRWAHQPYLN